MGKKVWVKIRIPEKEHKRLKVMAIEQGTTLEKLILDKVLKC